LVVDYPKTEQVNLKPLKGSTAVGGDDYYVQLVSEFELKGDNALKAGCNDRSPQYENGDLSAALLFNVQNETVKWQREVSGFSYQAAPGKCNFRLETKKALLTPWLRLDVGKDTAIDYSVFTGDSRDTNFSQLISDVNAASSLLVLTGVGTGVAVLGQVAGKWAEAQPVVAASATNRSAAKRSSETHSLSAPVVFSDDGLRLQRSHISVYDLIEGGWNPFGSENKLLGELKVSASITPSLLLHLGADGIPDARDSSLEELWRVPMQTGSGKIPLQQWLSQTATQDKPNLQPNWSNYSEVEDSCRKLKWLMKDLGFNKFDRNVVLYYFLAKSPDWRNFNITGQKAMADENRAQLLAQYRSRDFGQCLASEDYAVMKSMGLAVNTDQDWEQLTNSRQKRETAFSGIQSAARQFFAALGNADPAVTARQLYPLLITPQKGNGTVLLQNNLGFALEKLLDVPSIADEGVFVTALQLANVFAKLQLDEVSCVRPAQEQGQPLNTVGLWLFSTKSDSPLQKGGAMEFEINQGKITRLAFQNPAYRDFAQELIDYPERYGCRIERALLDKLR
jgi:hypothetical protein